MVPKIYSHSRTVQLTVLFLMLFSCSFLHGQNAPVFQTCSGASDVIIPADGSPINFDNTNIPSLLGVLANDPDGTSTITYTASPTGVSCFDVGIPTLITVTATDVDGSATCDVTVTVIDNTDPVPSCIPDITLELDMNGEIEVSGRTLLSEGFALGGGIDNTSQYCIIVPNNISFSWAWRYEGQPSSDFFTYSINGNPILLTTPAVGTNVIQEGFENITLNSGDEFCITLVNNATFPSDVATLFFPGLIGDLVLGNWTPSGSNAFYNAPDVMDNCSNNTNILVNGNQTVVLDCDDIGTSNLTVTAIDPTGNIGTCFVSTTVQDISDPVFDVGTLPMALVNADCNNIPAEATGVTATDNCGTPMVMLNTVTTQAGGLGSCSNYSYVITRTWTATDSEGNTATFEQVIQVADTEAPVISIPDEITVSTNTNTCDANVSSSDLFLTAANTSDNCSGIADLIITNDSPFGANATNDARGTYPEGSTVVKFTVTDPCGKITEKEITVTVVDDSAPTANCVAGLDITIPAGANSYTITPAEMDAGSFDNCNPVNLSISSNPVITCDMLTGAATSIDVTLMVTDQNNPNSFSECTEAVIFRDETPPVMMCQDITISVDQSGIVEVTPAMVDNGTMDACIGLASLTLTGANANGVIEFGIADLGQTETVELVAIDAAGNQASCTVNVTIEPAFPCFFVDNPSLIGDDVEHLSVQADDFLNVTSFSWTLEIDDIGVASFENTFTSACLPTYANIFDINPQLCDNGTFNIQVSPDGKTLAISWNKDALSPPISIPSGAELFKSSVSINGTIGSITDVNFMNAGPAPYLVNVQYGNDFYSDNDLAPCANDAIIEINNTATLGIGGNIFTWSANTFYDLFGTIVPYVVLEQPIPNVEMITNVNGAFFSADSLTDVNGDYFTTFPNVAGGSDVEVRPRKNTNWLNRDTIGFLPNGQPDVIDQVTSADLFYILIHTANIVTFVSNYQYIAADVNRDGIVNGLDYLLIQDVIQSPQGSASPSVVIDLHESWRFVKSPNDLDDIAFFPLPNAPDTFAYPGVELYPNLSSSLDGEDWIGVKIGNVFGDLDPTLLVSVVDEKVLKQTNAKYRSGTDFEMITEDQIVRSGELISIPIYSNDYPAFGAWQFTLEFDKDILEYNGMTSGALGSASPDNFGTNNLEEGYIGALWFGIPEQVNDEEPLFTLHFRALEDASALSQLMEVNSKIVTQESFLINGTKGSVSLEFTGNLQNSLSDDFELYQNIPNPFNDKTLISFNLPEDDFVTLTIYDISGKVISTVDGDFLQGYNEVEFSHEETNTAGVFYYQLETSNQTATKKMVILD
ncbi:MAG: T9SS type A sorting domain-containing protein [Bacteroidota bacterium]